MYFDSHAHYDDDRYNEDRHELLCSMKEAGVDYIVNSGSDVAGSVKGVELSKEYDFIYAAVGIHPHDVKTMNEDTCDLLETLCREPKVVAVGEIGLDYYYDNSPRDTQVKWFIRQLELAKKVNKPVIIHSRDASQETFDILKGSAMPTREGKGAGVIHCFSGSVEMAMEYIKLGYFVGIGGVITFSNAKKLVEVVERVPVSSILLETDCPYLSPIPNRGKRNDSQNIKYICQRISEIKQLNHEKIGKITKENAERFFDIKNID